MSSHWIVSDGYSYVEATFADADAAPSPNNPARRRRIDRGLRPGDRTRSFRSNVREPSNMRRARKDDRRRLGGGRQPLYAGQIDSKPESENSGRGSSSAHEASGSVRVERSACPAENAFQPAFIHYVRNLFRPTLYTAHHLFRPCAHWAGRTARAYAGLRGNV